jgi:hypothetical protein
VKRDIWAAITFLVTGLLFYLAQTSPPSESLLSDRDSGFEESITVGEPAPQVSADPVLDLGRMRDS